MNQTGGIAKELLLKHFDPWLVVAIILLGSLLFFIIKRSAGALLTDYLRSRFSISDTESSESVQSQSESKKITGDSIDFTGQEAQNQQSSHGEQTQESQYEIEGASSISSEKEQAQGENADDEDEDIMSDGGRVRTITPVLTAGIFGSDDPESGTASSNTADSSQQSQKQVDNVEVNVNVTTGNSNNGGDQADSDDSLNFSYHPYDADGNIDLRAFKEHKLPFYGVDGEAQIGIEWQPHIPTHWIKVESPDGYTVRLRDCKKAQLDNESEPPKFKPNEAAVDISVSIVVNTRMTKLNDFIIIKPERDAPIDMENDIYLSVTTVLR
jgi:hypothetical protein